jgi:hypothetical protein
MNATPLPLPRERLADCAAADPAPVAFSLFEGDRLRELFAALGMGTQVRFRLFKRAVALAFVTYVPMAVLAWRQGLVGTTVSPTNFFADFAAYAQFLVALPLYLAAEPIVDASTREAAKQFAGCGIVRADDRAELNRIHEAIRRGRLSALADAACVALAFFFSLVILVPQYGSGALPTWHVQDVGGLRLLTAPGIWLFFIALPLLGYIWLRLIWKIMLWIYYLYRITRIRLELHPTHPDLTGGIGFVSEAQGRFAVFILAYGIGNVAAPVGYQIGVLNYELTTLPVWGPLVLFGLGAPLLFTLPLFMFTRQLFRSKKRALAAYRERVTEHSRQVEEHWLFSAQREQPQEEIRELAELATLGSMFSRIEHMRVIPFDLRSFGQLVGSTLGAIATLLPLLHEKGDLAAIFDALGRLVGHATGG